MDIKGYAVVAVIVPPKLLDQNRYRLISQITSHGWAVRPCKLSIGSGRLSRYTNEQRCAVIACHHKLTVLVAPSDDGAAITGARDGVAHDVIQHLDEY